MMRHRDDQISFLQFIGICVFFAALALVLWYHPA
jgi:hypothetical protein